MVIARKYSDEVKERSVRRVLERRQEEPEARSILREVAEDFDVGIQSLRQWVAKVDDGTYDYQSVSNGDDTSRSRRSLTPAEFQVLEAQLDELREENEVLRRAIAVLSRRR